MNCKRYQEWLADKALGALDGRRDAELAAHLATCASCRAALDRERLLFTAIDRGVAQSVAEEPSPEIAVRIRQRIGVEAGQPRIAWRLGFDRWVPVAVAATLVVVLGSVWLLHRRAVQPAAVTRSVAQKQPPAVGEPANSAGSSAAQQSAAGVKPLPNENRASQSSIARVAARRPDGLARKVSPAEPEVLVEKDEAALVLEIYNAARTGRVDGNSLVSLPPSFKRDADGSLAPLEVPPLETADSGVSSSSDEPGGEP